MNDVRSYEQTQKAKRVQQQYGTPAEAPQL